MSVQYFLGSNSAAGFYSLYGKFASGSGDRLKLIKGGPGCGKSGFMRKLANEAEKRGFRVEYILCSGDPASLDGVYFPELRLGYVDATAPHILEPRHFGYDSCYVNLGQFCSDSDDERIPAFTEKYREMYSCAYSCLSAAGKVISLNIPDIFGETTLSRVEGCAKNTANHLYGGKSHSKAQVSTRFIRSLTCTGELVLSDTISELCKQIYLVDDRLGLAEPYFKELLKLAGGSVICCLSPLLPDRIEALLLPDDGTAFVSASLMPTAKAAGKVCLSALVPEDLISEHEYELQRRDEIYKLLISQAVYYLEKAKRYHDELEKCYHDTVDFDALDDFTAAEIRNIFD